MFVYIRSVQPILEALNLINKLNDTAEAYSYITGCKVLNNYNIMLF